ncbi:hypothetical protein BVY02_00695 [bacterium J17]|nr:hypothetical protein BVY02_00695 [bacterium J17]
MAQEKRKSAAAGRWAKLQSGGANAGSTLHLLGSWRMEHLQEIEDELVSLDAQYHGPVTIDGAQLSELDTSGAMLVLRHLSDKKITSDDILLVNFNSSSSDIMALVQARISTPSELAPKKRMGTLAEIGKDVFAISAQIRLLVEFIGHTCVEMFRSFRAPGLFRLNEFFVQLRLACINAIPIVVLLTFLVGIVVTYLFGTQAEQYGANIFLVDAVSIAMSRELAPIIVATVVAGRSGSAYTAQIGTMKLNEEIDAMRIIGLSPMKVLVIPRMVALFVAMPILVFLGDVSGILGGLLIADLRLGIPWLTFIDRMQSVLALKHVIVGLIKAPVFALFVAGTGCKLGLAVENNARSVGLYTTSSVVQSIVWIILLNASFAIIFMELGI